MGSAKIAHMKKYLETKKVWLLVVLIIIGALLRFYNLQWDQGFFLHPDERNIGYAVGNLDFAADDYNPNFFAYGTFPIYLLKILAGDDFAQVLLTGRFISAVLSTALIPLTFFFTKKILQLKQTSHSKQDLYAFIAAIVITFVPGMIQFAHFATFELILTFLYFLAAYSALLLSKSPRWRNYLLLSLILATSFATKIVSVTVFPLLLFAHILANKKKSILQILFSTKLILSLLVTLAVSFLLSPYNLLDWEAFTGSMEYEGSLADGSLVVFYTQQFLETTRGVYQFFKVFPYILGWALLVVACLGLVYYLLKLTKQILSGIRNRKLQEIDPILHVLAPMLFYLIPHLILFLKWTRYMVPVLPFLVVLSVVFLSELLGKYKLGKQKLAQWLVMVVVIVPVVLQGVNFTSKYLDNDPRVDAAEWVADNVEPNSLIISEVYDLGVVPIERKYSSGSIELFHFYELGNSPDATVEQLQQLQTEADYIILPSNRIYPTRARLRNIYPEAAKFYEELFKGESGYELVAHFERERWSDYLLEKYNGNKANSKITPYSDFFEADESFAVFDAPQVLIFKNTNK